MPVAELYGGITALKTVLDMLKAVKDMDTAADRNAAVIELQEKILSAYAAQTALLERVGQLETQLASLERWESEKERYELKELDRGFFAYVLKLSERATATPHAICTNCYERGFKSILHSNGEVQLRKHAWLCPSCNGRFPSEGQDLHELISALENS